MSRSADIARTVFRIANFPVDAVATIAGAGMLVAVVLQIVGRWVDNPLPWTEELTRYSFIWMVYMGVGIGFRRAESARVTMFLHFFPGVLRILAPLAYAAVSIGFFVVLLFAGFEVVGQQITMTERGAALDIPMWTIGLSVPVAGLVGILGVVESLILFFDRIRESRRVEE